MKDFFDRLLIVLLASFVIVFGVCIYFIPREEISEKENRVLADFPKLTLVSLTSGSFSKGLGDFYCDRFPIREKWLSGKCETELWLGRGENNGVVVCDGGYLCIRPEYSELDTYLENLLQIERFCENSMADTAVFFAPRGVDILTHLLPSGYPLEREQEIFEIAEEQNFEIINVNDDLARAVAQGDYDLVQDRSPLDRKRSVYCIQTYL